MIPESRYGLRKLVLINSGNFRLAEIPLDDSVSLVANNNTGKTSLINAMQFLLIANKARMDFSGQKARDVLPFYFPSNTSYILMEVHLESGTAVMGCVGKGVSHEYRYFAYRGHLDANDFRSESGAIIAEPDLAKEMARRNRNVVSYKDAVFHGALYGGAHPLGTMAPDISIYRVTKASHKDLYADIMVRTLALNRLTTSDIKSFLVAGAAESAMTSIDFQAEWDAAFRSVENNRAHHRAAIALDDELSRLRRAQDALLKARGAINALKGKVDRYSLTYSIHVDAQRALAKQQLEAADERIVVHAKAATDAAVQLAVQTRAIQDLEDRVERRSQLARRFAAVHRRSDLQEHLAHIEGEQSDLRGLLKSISNKPLPDIQDELDREQGRLKQAQEMHDGWEDNFGNALSEVQPPALAKALGKVFSASALGLRAGQYQVDASSIPTAEDGTLRFPGITLQTSGLPDREATTRAAIEKTIADGTRRVTELSEQLAAATNREAALAKLTSIEASAAAARAAIVAYDELTALRAQEPQDTASLIEANARHEGARLTVQESGATAARLMRERTTASDRIARINLDAEEVQRLMRERKDNAPAFLPLFKAVPHLPCAHYDGRTDYQIEDLRELLGVYRDACGDLISHQSKANQIVEILRAGGLNRYGDQSPDEEVRSLLALVDNRDAEAAVIDAEARMAVVHVGSCLLDIRKALHLFQRMAKEFNSLVAKRRISDLTLFRLEITPVPELQNALDILISAAETSSPGQTSDLLDQPHAGETINPTELEQAKRVLIDAGSRLGGLRPEHFFEVAIHLQKHSRPVEVLRNLDDGASTGTVITLKLVTGLAFLHILGQRKSNIEKVCYIDEAGRLDSSNQAMLVDAARHFGFHLILAAPHAISAATYCIPIRTTPTGLLIRPDHRVTLSANPTPAE